MGTHHKIHVLAQIAHALNAAGITWAVGGSMLLYFRHITAEFHDIDIMVVDEDTDAVRETLLRMGTLEVSKPKPQYKTKTFLEFTIDGVEVDVMAGFVIVKDGAVYDCSLKIDEIEQLINVEGEIIPLQAVATWRRYYNLMGKASKVRMIDASAR